MEMVMSMPIKASKPGRQRVISEEIVPHVVNLYDRGYGYRAIARILNNPEYGVNAHFSSIRKTLIYLGKVIEK